MTDSVVPIAPSRCDVGRMSRKAAAIDLCEDDEPGPGRTSADNRRWTVSKRTHCFESPPAPPAPDSGKDFLETICRRHSIVHSVNAECVDALITRDAAREAARLPTSARSECPTSSRFETLLDEIRAEHERELSEVRRQKEANARSAARKHSICASVKSDDSHDCNTILRKKNSNMRKTTSGATVIRGGSLAARVETPHEFTKREAAPPATPKDLFAPLAAPKDLSRQESPASELNGLHEAPPRPDETESQESSSSEETCYMVAPCRTQQQEVSEKPPPPPPPVGSCENGIPLPPGWTDEAAAKPRVRLPSGSSGEMGGGKDTTGAFLKKFGSTTPRNRGSSEDLDFTQSTTRSENFGALHEVWDYFLNCDDLLKKQEQESLSKRRAKFIRSTARIHGHIQGRSCLGLLSHFIANPASKPRLCWDVIGIILLAIDLAQTPLQAFDLPETEFSSTFRYVSSVFWIVDLISSFFVGYHKQGVVEMDPRDIAKHYLRTWFMLDFTLVCLDGMVLLFGMSSQSGTLRIGKVTRGVRAFKLLRVMKFRLVLGDLANLIRSEYARTMVDIFKIIFLIVAANHYIACGFYALHHVAPTPPDGSAKTTWVARHFDRSNGFDYRYFTALHWSLTQFTPASMEVAPVNSQERVFTVLVLLFALVTFSSFVSSITTAMTHIRQINAKKLDQDSKLLKYLSEHDISPQLTSRVLHFFQERAQQNRRIAHTKEDDVDLFQILPESIKIELRCEAFTPVLNIHPFFFYYGEYDEQSVQEICGSSLVERQLMIRDELYGHGTVVSHMFFVKQGLLEYGFMLDRITISEELKNGSWACEVCLWSQHPVVSNPFVANTNVELVMLWGAEFMRIVQMFPAGANIVAQYASKFMEVAGNLAIRCRMQTVLLNGHDEIMSMVTAIAKEEDEVVLQILRNSRKSSNKTDGAGRASVHGEQGLGRRRALPTAFTAMPRRSRSG